jgi:peptidoglycan/xylan/chitin deacetylase (PgdA/CDA1 family)
MTTLPKPLRNVTAALLLAASSSAAAAERQVAVTFDDLPGPAAGLVSPDAAFVRDNTRKLLAAFKAHEVPVVGFVNEDKLHRPGEPADAAALRLATLGLWLDAGLELGNHTFSHRSLNRTGLQEFEADVVRGETATQELLARRGTTLRYFRHPFLQVGLDLGKRRAFETFLKARGYTIAPVTMDNDEYMYAFVYADAVRRRDEALANKVASDYLRYMNETFAYAEALAQSVVGRDIRHILLLHANTLNADHFGALAEVLEKRGYRFITLEKALQDEAYALPDTYVGEWGVSWLTHWQLSAGKPRTPAPDPPRWLLAAYESLSISQ